MSIINDALKKAESSKDFKPIHSQDKYRQMLELEVQKKSKQVNWGPLFVLMVLFLITGPLIAPVFSTTFRRANFFAPSKAAYEVPVQTVREIASLPAPAASDNRKAQFGLEEIPLTPAISPQPPLPITTPKFNLSGVVFSKENSYCIINNKVIRVGEEVGGAKLTDVQPNEVKLLYQGEAITLSLPE